MAAARSLKARGRGAPALVAAIGLLLGAVLAACGGGSSSSKATDQADAGNLTYWYWAESDAPGANKWMAAMISRYEQQHPKVHIKLVPQSTDTLIGAFKTASQTKKGPDIATQWATLPVLTPAWTGASVPISDYVPASEIKNWIGGDAGKQVGRRSVGEHHVPAPIEHDAGIWIVR